MSSHKAVSTIARYDRKDQGSPKNGTALHYLGQEERGGGGGGGGGKY